MKTKIAKEFTWEMSHRLPFHKGDCKNIHGHTYRIRLEITGEPDANGIVIDYFELKNLVAPIISKLDHAFICDSSDGLMLDFLREHGMKYFELDCPSTAENIAHFFLKEMMPLFVQYTHCDRLRIRLQETEDVYAEVEYKKNPEQS